MEEIKIRNNSAIFDNKFKIFEDDQKKIVK